MFDYYHHYGKLTSPSGHRAVRDAVIPINGHNVLAIQMRDERRVRYVKVIGDIKSKKSLGDIQMSSVDEVIQDPEINEALRKNYFSGKIIYLPRSDSPEYEKPLIA